MDSVIRTNHIAQQAHRSPRLTLLFLAIPLLCFGTLFYFDYRIISLLHDLATDFDVIVPEPTLWFLDNRGILTLTGMGILAVAIALTALSQTTARRAIISITASLLILIMLGMIVWVFYTTTVAIATSASNNENSASSTAAPTSP